MWRGQRLSAKRVDSANIRSTRDPCSSVLAENSSGRCDLLGTYIERCMLLLDDVKS